MKWSAKIGNTEISGGHDQTEEAINYNIKSEAHRDSAKDANSMINGWIKEYAELPVDIRANKSMEDYIDFRIKSVKKLQLNEQQ